MTAPISWADRLYAFPDWASNFYPSPLTFGGLTYATVEHAFQAAKTLNPTWQRAIRTADGPGTAKSLGRRAPLREDWEDIKYTVMLELTRLKYLPGTPLADELAALEGDIVEWNVWHDNIWGICLCGPCPRVGQNLLGQALETVRAELQGGRGA